MIIFGAGMSGCIAGVVFDDAIILESGDSPAMNHKALLRFRDDTVAKAVGIPFKKVRVHKAIWYHAKERPVTPQMMNLYSQKVTGRFMDRSIANMDPVTRWVAPPDFHQRLLDRLDYRIHYNHRVTGLYDNGIAVTIQGQDGIYHREPIGRGPIISTLPIYVNAGIAGMEAPEWNYDDRQVFVTKLWVHNCDCYTSVYYPDPDVVVARASITGDTLIIESMLPLKPGSVATVAESMGLRNAEMDVILEDQPQLPGKIVPMTRADRRDFIYNLTTKENIYSLGRFATWRNVLIGDVLQDAYAIRDMIQRDGYSRRRGK